MAQQRVVLRHRLNAEGFEAGAAQLAALECGVQVGIDDHRAARGVDEIGAVFHLRQRGRVDQAGGLGRHARVQRDDVGLRQQRRQIDLFDAGRAVGVVQSHIGVAHQNAAAKGAQQLGHFAADVAIADQPDGLVAQLFAGAVGAVQVAAPFAAH